MAVGRVILPIPGGVAPDGSGSGNIPAILEKIVSSGAQTSNTPKVSYVQLVFDQGNEEHWMWNFQLPTDYASGGTLRLLWGSKVTSGSVVWKAGIEIADASSTDLDSSVYNTSDLSAAVSVPASVGRYQETAITLTMTGATAGEWTSIFVGRDATNASDSAAGDATLVAATFEYVT